MGGAPHPSESPTAPSKVQAIALWPASFGASSPHAALVCAGTWRGHGAAYDAVIQQVCSAVDGRFVSLRGLYAVGADRGPAGVSGFYGVSDDIAPNNAGHRAITRALLAAIGIGLS